MDDPARNFYDDLAESYHLLFQDWPQSIQRQAHILGNLLEREIPVDCLRILDWACGIGTQTLGLAMRGHSLTGVDLSVAAIARAKREARQRNLAIQFEAMDMRDLKALAETGFDAVVAMDNAFAHFLNEHTLSQAVQEIAEKLRPGGLFMASIRDYDQIVEERVVPPPAAFFQDGEYRRIYHQVWDWINDRQYSAHLYLTHENGSGWTCRHFVYLCRALLREEFTAILHQASFTAVHWLTPAESGFYQPLVLARIAE